MPIVQQLNEMGVSIQDTGWLHTLPVNQRHFLLDGGRLIKAEKGQRLLSRGTRPEGLYGLIAGKLKISGANKDGREAILTFIEPPEWFGEISVFDGEPATHDVTAENESSLIFIPQRHLAEVLSTHPEIWLYIGKLLAQKMRRIFKDVEELVLLPVRPRLARRLLMLAYNQGQSRTTLPYSQEQIGSTIGLTRQTTNQILKELEVKSAIKVSYGKIEILNLELLRSLSTFY